MNVDTGELVRLKDQERKVLIAGGFEPVPAELRAAAEKKLTGRDRTVVSLSSGGKLSKWARFNRRNHQYAMLKEARGAKNRKADRKKKDVQESRRRNRG